jgi:hypothetical protein
MRIMTQNYIKSLDFEKKFRNRDQQDVLVDDEYQRFKEEEINTKKMSTILKNLNSPRRRTASSGFNRGTTGVSREVDSFRISRTDRGIPTGRNERTYVVNSQGSRKPSAKARNAY